MDAFSASALGIKLVNLTGSKRTVQTLSKWLIHHRKHFKLIVRIWFLELVKAPSDQKLYFVYLANDILQSSKKFGPQFCSEFSFILPKVFAHVCETAPKKKIGHKLKYVIRIWKDRRIYSEAQIMQFLKVFPKNG